jgi:hypothetical protein
MITLDGQSRRIILDAANYSAAQIWTAWVDWQALNPQWPLAFALVGGIDLGGGAFIPPYFFLRNGWRVRPMEASHVLKITGNLVVEGGGDPVVPTLGNFNVSTQYTVPVAAQGVATGGGLTPEQETWLLEMWRLLGLDPAAPLVATPAAITAGPAIDIALTGDGETSKTATRQP